MLQWYSLLCSTAIDCFSTCATVVLSAVQYSDRLLFYLCYSGTVCCAVQRQIAVLPVLQLYCLLCSTEVVCCSTGATVALSAVQYSDRLLFYCCYSGSLLCSTTTDCCSTGATVALSVVQYNNRLLFYRCYIGTVCCAVER